MKEDTRRTRKAEPHGSRFRVAARALAAALLAVLLLGGCAGKENLLDLQSTDSGEYRGIVWEDRVYWPFCVVSKQERGKQIGYVDGDTDDRVSAYGDYPVEEWLVSWMPMDGGAMLLKEESVTEIPPGLEREYG